MILKNKLSKSNFIAFLMHLINFLLKKDLNLMGTLVLA